MPPDAPLAPEIFRLAVEASPSGMVLVDGGGAIVMVNGEIERLFGYGRDELRGQPVEILLPDKLRGRHVRQRAGFVKHPEVRHLGTGREFLGRHKNGSEIPIEVGLNPLRVGDDFMMLCAIVDISERKRFERMQDEFVSTVSHELRTPMTSISASLALMSGGAAGALSPSAAHLIEIAYGNCRRLVRLVNDILDIKKLESGQMDFRFKACDARALAAQAIEANHEFAEGYGVRVRLDAATEPSNVQVDPDRFVQVVTNLLSNAIKFSPTGGEVVISIKTCGANVRVSVRDHGAGIPDDFKLRIFEKFAQANTVREQQKGGTGLGLSIVRQIVMHMQGQIGFDDAPGGGTIFFLDLPAADRMARRQVEFTADADPAPLAPDNAGEAPIVRERVAGGAS